jgi:DNA-binding beta-propeller fold protein YncE
MRSKPILKTILVLFFVAGCGAALILWPTDAPVERTELLWQEVGKRGLLQGEFNQPRGITVLNDGSFIVVDRSSRVQHFSEKGRALSLWEMPEHAKGNPKGLCILPNGHLLVCDTHYGRLLEMTIEGAIVKEWAGYGTKPGQLIHPLSCLADPRHNAVYVVEYGGYNDRVQKYSLDGRFLKAWGSFGSEPGQFRRPSGVTVDSHGCVYVADAANHRIQKFDAEGTLLRVFGQEGRETGQLSYPFDVACDAEDRIYVADYNNHRVDIFDAEGTYLEALGGPGQADGQFKFPWSLTVDPRGRLLVSDTGNSRVQIRALPARPVAQVQARER